MSTQATGQANIYSSPHVARMLHVVEGKVNLSVFAQRTAKVTHRQVQVMGRRTNFRILTTSGRQSRVPLINNNSGYYVILDFER